MSSPPLSDILEILQYRALNTPDKMTYTFLKDGSEIEKSYTYSELDLHARAIAKSMGKDVNGKRALLIFPPGVEFLAGFFGALYAGAIPIPAPPPDLARLKRTLPRLRSIIQDADAAFMLTTSSISNSLNGDQDALLELPQMQWIAVDEVDPNFGKGWDEIPEVDLDRPAYLQYTSGSTSTPKGVMVTHRNVIANCKVITHGFSYDENCVEVTWMPYFHDYGLVDGLMLPLYHGGPCYILSPLTFVRRPERWLQAISRFGGTHTQAPNFAYEQCVRRISDDVIDTLDLSSMVTFSSGGEPIRTETVKSFMSKFERCGLKPEAVCPAFGLAEATLVVSGKTREGGPVFCHVDTEAYKNDQIIELLPDDPNGRTVTSSGVVLNGVDVAIADPDTLKNLPDGQIGEVWVGGESIGAGYWQLPEESERTFRARLSDDPERGTFLRTGDLGFKLRNNLFITGRAKDLIIIAGVNHYPQDIELTVQNADDVIRTDHCVAFPVEAGGEERLVVVAEVDSKRNDWDSLLATLRKAVSETHELDLYALQLIRRGTILKTSSGKLQRRKCKEAFLNDEFETIFSWKKELTAKIEAKPVIEQTKSRFEIENWLKNIVSVELGVPVLTVDENRPLAEYGMTSRAAVIIVGQLENWLGGQELPSTLLWEYATIGALAKYLTNESAPDPAVATKDTDTKEPIAIVGLSCRFPGAPDVDSFWKLLLDEVDAITEVPADRWDADQYFDPESGKPGYINNRFGGFIDHVDQFDAAFFGISPAEATVMDPQQRLLMELAWRSFESAGIDPNTLSGTDCGVFVGISTNDYAELQFNDRFALNPYTGPGKSSSIAANRLSYFFDFKGPSMAIDTACSSSLVAVHQALSAIRNGDCSTALVGGINLLLSPKMTIALSQAQMLSSDGHCKAFDAAANGYVRSEGGGMVVLKRLSDAKRDGDNIFAVIKGSAINQDGKSNGLTAPNALSQQAVIQKALIDSGTNPQDIQYIEAHGTGTALGDPIEVGSIQKVLSTGRKNGQICTIGSVKSNIGHLEAAAGIAGLIKLALSIHNGIIPANSNFKKLNELIKIDGTPFEIASKQKKWKQKTRVAGISSFGFGGANAHVILQSPPEAEPTSATKNTSIKANFILPLSAKTDTALKAVAKNNFDFISVLDDAQLGDLCYSTCIGHAAFKHRKAVVGNDKTSILEQLSTIEAQDLLGNHQLKEFDHLKTVWLFTGQGSQYTGMAKNLYENEPLFKAELDYCDQILEPLLGCSLVDLLWEKSFTEKLNHTKFTQPAMFAVQVSLARMLMNWGMKPDAVIGYSVGEYAAACIAGIMSVEDGLKILAARGRLVADFGKPGTMAAIMTDEKTARNVLGDNTEVELATLNGPAGQVMAGTVDSIESAIQNFEKAGIECRKLNVSHAFHTKLMDDVLKPFKKVVDTVEFSNANIPVLSNLNGAFNVNEMSSSDYWVDHLRKPVFFGASMELLFSENYQVFVEIGPKPVMSGMASRFKGAENCLWLPTMRPDETDSFILYQTLATLWEIGLDFNWKKYFDGFNYSRIVAPAYPFEHKRYWIESTTSDSEQKSTTSNQLLGDPIQSPMISGTLFQSDFDLKTFPFYREHEVFEEFVVPAAGHLSLLLEASQKLWKNQGCRISDVIFPTPLILSEKTTQKVQLFVSKVDDDTNGAFKLITVDESGASVDHANGNIKKVTESQPLLAKTDLKSVQKLCPTKDSRDFYSSVWQPHIQLGPTFRWVNQVFQGDGQVLIELKNLMLDQSLNQFELFPGLMDAALQGLTALVDMKDDEVTIPFNMKEIVYYGRAPHKTNVFWSQIVQQHSDETSALSDVRIWENLSDGDSRLILEIAGFGVRKVKRELLLRDLSQGYKNDIYALKWISITVDSPTKNTISDTWICLDDHKKISSTVAKKSGFEQLMILDNSTKFDAQQLDDSVRGIIWGGGLNLKLDSDESEYESAVSSLLSLNKKLSGTDIPVIILTSGGFQLDEIAPVDPSQRAIWGFGKVLLRESANSNFYLVDLDQPESTTLPIHQILEKNLNELLVRNGQFYQPQLTRLQFTHQKSTKIKKASSYLITGGLGDLGIELTKWLIQQGAENIVITGRRPQTAENQSIINSIESKDTIITYQQMDVSDPKACKKLFSDLKNSKIPLKGIFHLAGSTEDGMATELNWDRFKDVLAPKILGIQNLHESSKDLDLDLFVAYSSATSVLGTAGQANYAMANAYMDAFIAQRNAKNLPGLSINWGPWNLGLAADLAPVFKNQGVRMMDSNRAMQTFESMLGQDEHNQLMVMPVDWNQYTEINGTQIQLQNLITQSDSVVPSTQKTAGIGDELRKAKESERWNLLQNHIQQITSSFLHISDSSTLPLRKRLFEIGLDSLGAVELKNRLARILGVELRSTLLFDYPTVEDLVEHIGSQVFKWTHLNEVPVEEKSISDDSFELTDDISDDDLAAMLMKELGDE